MSRMSKEVAIKITNSVANLQGGTDQSDFEYAKSVIKKINGETEDESSGGDSSNDLLQKLMSELKNGSSSSVNTGSDLESFHKGDSKQIESPSGVHLAGLSRSLAPICVIIGGVLLGNGIVLGAGLGMALVNKLADKKIRSVHTLKSLKIHEMNEKYMSLDPETRKMFPENKGFQIDKEGNIVLLAKLKMTYEHINPKTKNLERWIFLESHNNNPEQIIRCTIQNRGFFRVKSNVKFDVFETNHEKSLLEDFSKSFKTLEELSP